jgi:hypothetical protein
MNRLILAVLIALVAAPIAVVLAHPGHEHKIMGTVSMVHENHLEVKATDGKTTVVTLNDKTKVVRGSTAAKLDTVKVGERVVVTAVQAVGKDGKALVVAKEVRLGAGHLPGPES